MADTSADVPVPDATSASKDQPDQPSGTNEQKTTEVDDQQNIATESATSPNDNDADEWINIADDGGIKKKILVKGDESLGHPPTNSDVTCHYTGTLTADGSKFDSSRDRNTPFNFKLGTSQVIKCWDQGIATMYKGERAILRCTSDYGYGDSGSGGSIPGGAGLDFDVELISWKEPSQFETSVSPGIDKCEVTKGDGYKRPRDEARVIFSYKAFYLKEELKGGKKLTETTERESLASGDHEVWEMDEGDDKYPIKGLTSCIKNMKLNEKSWFRIEKEEALRSGVGDESKSVELPNVPDSVENIYVEVELHSFENPKETWECHDPQDKIDEADTAKIKGNRLFQAQKFEQAKKSYERAEKFLKENDVKDAKDEALAGKAKEMTIMVKNNIAMTDIKLGNFTEAMKKCDEVLEIDGDNIKALSRRGNAQLNLGNYKEAKVDFNKALEKEPENAYVKALLKKTKHEIKKYKNKEKKLYGNMFK